MLLQLSGISKLFGAELILSNINLQVKENDRVAIVGRNGAGKSTLLKIIANELSYDEGEIFKRKNLTIGYLPQHTSLESQETIWEEMLSVFHDLLTLKEQLRKYEISIQELSSQQNADYHRLLEEYDNLQQTFTSQGGYRYESDIKMVLSGLDFHKEDYDKRVNELSGGQKSRLALGKLLLQKPELLVLDEPTNHLDIETMSWLESYLQSYPGSIVIVSHDRYFLDKTVHTIYEISRHEAKKYVGSYSRYLTQRHQDYERELKAYEQQQAEIKKMEEFIERNIARASTTKRAQSRRKQLEKMERLAKPVGDESSAQFSFQINKRSGNDVLNVENVSFRYDADDDLIFSDVHFRITRGERVAIVGPNGVGKTTLLKLILGKWQSETGSIQHGTNVEIGYYDQELADLSSNKTVLAELWDAYPMMMEKDIRTVLGNFLFSGDDVLQPVHSLSGGEKARLALAKLMLQKANFLVLDEPTNHLDIDSKEVLEQALMNYPGTIIFVSHDRYFINRIADKILEMSQNGVTTYLGNYDYYLAKKQEEIELARLSQGEQLETDRSQRRKDRYEQEKAIQREQRRKERQIKQLEEEIFTLEEEIAELEEAMTLPEVYEDHEKSLAYSKQVDELKQQVNQLMEEWTRLHE